MDEEKYCEKHKQVVRHTDGKCSLCQKREEIIEKRSVSGVSGKSRLDGSVSTSQKLAMICPKCGSIEQVTFERHFKFWTCSHRCSKCLCLMTEGNSEIAKKQNS